MPIHRWLLWANSGCQWQRVRQLPIRFFPQEDIHVITTSNTDFLWICIMSWRRLDFLTADWPRHGTCLIDAAWFVCWGLISIIPIWTISVIPILSASAHMSQMSFLWGSTQSAFEYYLTLSERFNSQLADTSLISWAHSSSHITVTDRKWDEGAEPQHNLYLFCFYNLCCNHVPSCSHWAGTGCCRDEGKMGWWVHCENSIYYWLLIIIKDYSSVY